MKSDGKQLEGIVSFVEKTLLPQGFDIKTNERVYNDEGVQIAEFDIEVHGKIGSTTIAWLIECRDRPGKGPAPGSWIEQLVGRRFRFGFNKVTAVSTTGFAVGAVDFAQKQGIELREMKSLNPAEFAQWLVMQHYSIFRHVTKLEHATILINKEESEDRREALAQLISNLPGDAKFLRSSKSGEVVASAAAFLGAVSEVGTLFDDLNPNSPIKQISLLAKYPDEEDHFIVDTKLGPIRIAEILFEGGLTVCEQQMPLALTAEYRQAETEEPISQVASFGPHSIDGLTLSLEIHRIADTGETHVILRKVAG